MPRIEMRDAFGTSYRIDTASDETLQAWFDEWLPRLFPAGLSGDYGEPLILRVEPLYPGGADSAPDWPTWGPMMNEPFYIRRNPAEALPELGRRREWIEQEATKRGYR